MEVTEFSGYVPAARECFFTFKLDKDETEPELTSRSHTEPNGSCFFEFKLGKKKTLPALPSRICSAAATSLGEDRLRNSYEDFLHDLDNNKIYNIPSDIYGEGEPSLQQDLPFIGTANKAEEVWSEHWDDLTSNPSLLETFNDQQSLDEGGSSTDLSDPHSVETALYPTDETTFYPQDETAFYPQDETAFYPADETAFYPADDTSGFEPPAVIESATTESAPPVIKPIRRRIFHRTSKTDRVIDELISNRISRVEARRRLQNPPQSTISTWILQRKCDLGIPHVSQQKRWSQVEKELIREACSGSIPMKDAIASLASQRPMKSIALKIQRERNKMERPSQQFWIPEDPSTELQ